MTASKLATCFFSLALFGCANPNAAHKSEVRELDRQVEAEIERFNGLAAREAPEGAVIPWKEARPICVERMERVRDIEIPAVKKAALDSPPNLFDLRLSRGILRMAEALTTEFIDCAAEYGWEMIPRE